MLFFERFMSALKERSCIKSRIYVTKSTFGKRFISQLYMMIQDVEIAKIYKVITSLRWVGHVKGRDKSKTIRQLLEAQSGGKSKVGHPRHRWQRCVEQDMEMLGIRNGWRVVKDKSEWRRILQEVKARE